MDIGSHVVFRLLSAMLRLGSCQMYKVSLPSTSASTWRERSLVEHSSQSRPSGQPLISGCSCLADDRWHWRWNNRRRISSGQKLFVREDTSLLIHRSSAMSEIKDALSISTSSFIDKLISFSKIC
ncbi:hypothetical protein RRG08_034093 [Elysia crispata]|uniref:Secreted protein n=1 Tax=Elysia crispata TaxID=231223 RepID=A0AAE0YSR9_9GAST|nr:hypothetical protein RRG08_034093 [Elysia crispata]